MRGPRAYMAVCIIVYTLRDAMCTLRVHSTVCWCVLIVCVCVLSNSPRWQTYCSSCTNQERKKLMKRRTERMLGVCISRFLYYFALLSVFLCLLYFTYGQHTLLTLLCLRAMVIHILEHMSVSHTSSYSSLSLFS